MTLRLRLSMFAASSARQCVLVLSAAMAVALASFGPIGVKAQQPAASQSSQPAPAPASDTPPATQAPAPAQSSPSTPAPPPESQPTPQQPATDQPQPTQPAPATAPAPSATPQQTEPAAPAENPPAPAPAPADSQPAPATSPKAPSPSSEPNEITEDEIKALLVGKELFLRGGYLDNDLSYNENGVLVGHSPQGSYTLSAIQIDKVHLTRHKLELEGQRFGLHFLGALPYEDPTKAVDRVNITPKKKLVKITIDRELVVKPKEKKEKEKGNASKQAPKVASVPSPASPPAPPAAAPAAAAPIPASSTASPVASPAPPAESNAADTEAQAEIASAPPAERPADAKSVTTTTSQAHSNKLLRDAIGNVFAQGFDTRLMDAMPEFWKLYYAAAAAKTDYQPADPNVLRQSMVDKKASLVSTVEPASNEYAQGHGVAGICLYHVVIGADGKPGEIAVGRPIGFGLDENAVAAIRKANFEPAIKDGKPVPVLLDLVVQFRIYSKRTAVRTDANKPAEGPAEPSLPGPYSVQHQ